MFEKLKAFNLTQRLPILGILAFALCSVNSLAHLFLEHAKHPTPVLWFAAMLVELVTAWLVYGTVDAFRQVTKSRISKQDRKFYSGILVVFLLALVPSLALSIMANAAEFDNLALGFVFPVLAVACAIGAALPETVGRHEKAKAKTEDDKATQKRRKEKDKVVQLTQTLGKLGANSRQVLVQIGTNGGKTQAELGKTLSMTRQTLAYHCKKLAKMGLVKTNGGGYELAVELPKEWRQ